MTEFRIFFNENNLNSFTALGLTDEQKRVLIDFMDRGEVPEDFKGFPGWGVTCDQARKSLAAME